MKKITILQNENLTLKEDIKKYQNENLTLKEDIKKYQNMIISKQEEILTLKDDIKKLYTSEKLIGSDAAFSNYKKELFNKVNKLIGIRFLLIN